MLDGGAHGVLDLALLQGTEQQSGSTGKTRSAGSLFRIEQDIAEVLSRRSQSIEDTHAPALSGNHQGVPLFAHPRVPCSTTSATGPASRACRRYFVAVCTQTPSESIRALTGPTPRAFRVNSCSSRGRAAMMSSRSHKLIHC